MTRYDLCIRKLNSLLGAAKQIEVRNCEVGTGYADGAAEAAREIQEIIQLKIETVKGMQDFVQETKSKIMEAEADGK